MNDTFPTKVDPLFAKDRRFITTRFIKVYNEKEAAEALGISRITLQRIRLRGGISFSRVGNSIRYTAKNLTDFLAACERPAVRNC